MQVVISNNELALAEGLKGIAELTSQEVADRIGFIVRMRREGTRRYTLPNMTDNRFQIEVQDCYRQKLGSEWPTPDGIIPAHEGPVTALDVVIEPYTSGNRPSPPPPLPSVALQTQYDSKLLDVRAGADALKEMEASKKPWNDKKAIVQKSIEEEVNETRKLELLSLIEDYDAELRQIERDIDASNPVHETDKALLENIRENLETALAEEKPLQPVEEPKPEFKWPAQYLIYFTGNVETHLPEGVERKLIHVAPDGKTPVDAPYPTGEYSEFGKPLKLVPESAPQGFQFAHTAPNGSEWNICKVEFGRMRAKAVNTNLDDVSLKAKTVESLKAELDNQFPKV